MVQQTFIFAMSRSDLVPTDTDGQIRWLIRVLKYRVRQLLERQSKNANLGALKHTPSVPSRDRRESGTLGHYLAAAAMDRSSEQPSSFDDVLAGLSESERDLLFESAGADAAGPQVRRRRTELVDALRQRFAQSALPGVAAPTPSMRVLAFIDYYALAKTCSSSRSESMATSTSSMIGSDSAWSSKVFSLVPLMVCFER